jgi:iron(III) transport system ATP-binding protein
VLFNGNDVTHLGTDKREAVMVFQSYALWPHMTVRRNVAFGLEERRVPRAEIERRVDAALDLVGLKHLADRRPSQLSGGQQQRVALARTVVIEPKILLLDEPLSNLDAKLRVQMRQELLSLQRKLGLTTIFVTHDQEEANTICDRIAVMDDGKVQQVGTPQDLYDHPANLFVAGFLGTANVLDGTVQGRDGGTVFVADGVTPVALPPSVAPGAAGKLMFRPQNLIIRQNGRQDGAPPAFGHARLTGNIRHREFLGASIRYAVDVGGQLVQVDAPHQTGDALLAPDAPIILDLAADKARFLSP